jgi:hypothetical protein
VNAKYPDYKHKKTHEALWLVDQRNPPSWVEPKMAVMALEHKALEICEG